MNLFNQFHLIKKVALVVKNFKNILSSVVLISIFKTSLSFGFAASCDCEGEKGYIWVNDRDRNPRDGGCVGPGAYVIESTFISQDSKVCGSAVIKGRTVINGASIITGEARVSSSDIYNGAYLDKGVYDSTEVNGAGAVKSIKINHAAQSILELTNVGGTLNDTVFGYGIYSSSSSSADGKEIDCEHYKKREVLWEDGYCRVVIKERKVWESVKYGDCKLKVIYNYATDVIGDSGRVLESRKSARYGDEIDFKRLDLNNYQVNNIDDYNFFLAKKSPYESIRSSAIGSYKTDRNAFSDYWENLETLVKNCH
ncbi:hypothetical protein Sden_1608 [Shewanella denitrificans OS217]|uniref:Uncharacterized protein n=1 Tax=Shewanella denitrificans (strain OS217 / ATCC BAA-1090 / DSM 15013) TaxID=318161 RepID=Q12NT4_SHEDO|nr:hypothetical protein Sden_1608 [Shewanella denitrificans OS217]